MFRHNIYKLLSNHSLFVKFNISHRYIMLTLYVIVTHDLVKTDAPFWGGVEVACSYTSLGHAILPKAVRFPPLPLLFFSAGTTSPSLFPCFYT